MPTWSHPALTLSPVATCRVVAPWSTPDEGLCGPNLDWLSRFDDWAVPAVNGPSGARLGAAAAGLARLNLVEPGGYALAG